VAAVTARDMGIDAVTAPPFSPVDAATEAVARERLSAADVTVLAGDAPASVRALVRDHDRLVRVDDESGAGGEAGVSAVGDGGGVDPVATADLPALVDAVNRAARQPLGADD
jgi:hypothetical protein